MGKRIVISIGIIEILIGAGTLAGMLSCFVLSCFNKPSEVLVFVSVSSTLSVFIGIGLIRRKEFYRKILVLFSGYIVLTKILIFMHLLKFTGEIVAFIPSLVKDITSVLYHALIIFVFSSKNVRENFHA